MYFEFDNRDYVTYDYYITLVDTDIDILVTTTLI